METSLHGAPTAVIIGSSSSHMSVAERCGGPFIVVDDQRVKYTDEFIISRYVYESVEVVNVRRENNMQVIVGSKHQQDQCDFHEGIDIAEAHGEFTNAEKKKAEKNVKLEVKENKDKIIMEDLNMENKEVGRPHTLHVRRSANEYILRTQRRIPAMGLLVVGIGGNNGTTLVGGILANRHGLTFETKDGICRPNYWGSICLASTVRLADDIFVPLYSLVPFLDPNELTIGGWDISGVPMGDAMRRACVFDKALQDQLYPLMQHYTPLKSVFFEDFVAPNQRARADNILDASTHRELLLLLRQQIRNFKIANNLDGVIIMWSANTERSVQLLPGINDSAYNLLHTINHFNHPEISPSILYAVASILEGCSYINGSPQNTIIDGVIELANINNVFVGGNDFKSGQTKVKSVLVDFLISAGIKPKSIVSYNHLGNNDGYNLSHPMQFRSKEISKAGVVNDMIKSNKILYEPGECPDHIVTIKYCPYVGDSKRAMDEYISEIFMGGRNTLVIHNTCEDSLLAAPLMLDLVLLTELCHRITIERIVMKNETSKRSVAFQDKSNNPVSKIKAEWVDENDLTSRTNYSEEATADYDSHCSTNGTRYGPNSLSSPYEKLEDNGLSGQTHVSDKSSDFEFGNCFDDSLQRMKKQFGCGNMKLHPVLSLLSYCLKAPVVPKGSPVINSLYEQRECIVNFLRACVGLPPDNHLLLEGKFQAINPEIHMKNNY